MQTGFSKYKLALITNSDNNNGVVTELQNQFIYSSVFHFPSTENISLKEYFKEHLV